MHIGRAASRDTAAQLGSEPYCGDTGADSREHTLYLPFRRGCSGKKFPIYMAIYTRTPYIPIIRRIRDNTAYNPLIRLSLLIRDLHLP